MRTPEEIAQEIGKVDRSVDAEYKDALEDAYRQARAALLTIAGGVPRMDEWASAADYMESTAEVLDRFQIERPDHYDSDPEAEPWQG